MEMEEVMKKLALTLAGIAGVGAGVALWMTGPSTVFSQAPPSVLGEGIASIRVELGLTDRAPADWSGTLSVSGGEVVALRNWRPRPGDAIDGTRAFRLATRNGVLFNKRPYEFPYPQPQRPYILRPGLIIDVKGGATTKLRLETKNGAVEFSPFGLTIGAPPRTELNGAVSAERVAASEPISTPGTQSDHPAITAGPGGELWAAWTAFAGNGNSVLARRYDGRNWSGAEKISESHNDIFLVRAGRDRANRPVFVWSAQVNGNFDLYARTHTGNGWSGITRLTEDAGPDIYPNLARDSAGNLWVAWQGARNGKTDIFARRYDGAGWSAAEKVSSSAANDWMPAVAADSKGRVYVAWDTYDKGNYDIVMRSFENGAWSRETAVAASPKFEAYISLACDEQDRLWAAWNEGGYHWGKDTGFLVKYEGSRLYDGRTAHVAVWDNGQWMEPAVSLERGLPARLRNYNDVPVVQADGAGKVWVFFRHRLNRIQDVPPDAPNHRAGWEIFGTYLDGDQWAAPVLLPSSVSRQDVRNGFTSDGKGNVYLAYSTDHRDFEEFLNERFEVLAARMPAAPSKPARLKAREFPDHRLAYVQHPNEAQDLARIHGYAMTSGGKTYRIYRGDTHRHTEFSMDGNNDGSLPDAYRYAIDAAELDFLMVSEHNGAAGPDVEYINFYLQQAADVYTLPGKFLPLYGYERSVSYPNGHRNVVFAKRGNPTLPIPREEAQGKEGAAKLYQYLKKYGGIAISHTSASNMGTDWRDNDPEVEPLVEIYQGDRVSAEYEGAPKAAHTTNPNWQPGGFRPAGYVWNAWAKGYKLGIQAASDHLSTHISYACTLATEFTRQGLLDAMKLRHSYGATDNIILDYRMDAGGAERLQGEIVNNPGSFRLNIKAIGTKPIRQIDIVRSNKFIHTSHPLTGEVSFTFTDPDPLSGESYYYVRVQQVDDQIAWSSPIWVKR
jgi:hypothetical protein